MAASHGDGSGLRGMALGFVVDIDGSPWSTPNGPSPATTPSTTRCRVAAGTLARQLAGRCPRIGGYAVNYNLGGCVTWPNSRQPVSGAHPSAAPPVLVIGNTGDPNTPLDRGQAPGRAVPARQSADLGRLGPHLVAQRFLRHVRPSGGLALSAPRCASGHRLRLQVTRSPNLSSGRRRRSCHRAQGIGRSGANVADQSH